MLQQLTALLHIITDYHHGWVSGNGLHAQGVKLFAVNTYYQLKRPVGKHVSAPLRPGLLIILMLLDCD